jgi:hypothetical protein
MANTKINFDIKDISYMKSVVLNKVPVDHAKDVQKWHDEATN